MCNGGFKCIAMFGMAYCHASCSVFEIYSVYMEQHVNPPSA